MPYLQRQSHLRLVMSCVTLVALGALPGCRRPDASVTPAPTPVKVVTVTTAPAEPPIDVTGVVEARDALRLSFKIGGVVRSVAVREGERVRKGQLLAQLDPAEIGAQVEQAHQMAAKADRDLQRGEALQADQVIPLEQLQNLRTQAEVARSQLRAAQFNQRYASINAPADGVILRRSLEVREFAAPGQVAFVLGRADSGYIVRFAVADRSIVQLQRGDAVELHIDAWPDDTFKATVSQIASGADSASGLFEVEAQLDPAAHSLVSGLVGRVRLWPHGDAAQLPAVPLGAVLEGNGRHAQVFVVEGAVARRRAVEVAYIAADTVAIRRGLSAGERIVAVGAPYLEDGGRIAVTP
jgi:RND family efflux transporter MFP subunit